MAALDVPKTVIKAIDRRRRAFFWTGEDVCHGSKCLVAWEDVCVSKDGGGLGIKDLEQQNRCLLMKFIDKLFSNDLAPWKNWILRDAASFDTPTNGSQSYLWKIISDELDTYRSITYVNVHNGASTSFWFDHWLPGGPLNITHAALFSHSTRPNVSVQRVFQSRFDLCLRPRLTNSASVQLAALLSCLQDVVLTEEPDDRRLKLTGRHYTSKDAYTALDSSQDSTDLVGQRIWRTRVPNKVNFFCLVVFQGQIKYAVQSIR